MTGFPYRTALIVGTGGGISASVARRLSALGVKVGLAARDIEKLQPLLSQIDAVAFAADARDPDAVIKLFDDADRQLGGIEVVIYNAGARVTGALAELDPAAVADALAVNAFGAFLVVQQAAKRMVPRGRGAVLLTGATASIKGFARSSAFAMGKFALRGLAQSAARELGMKGIHVAHFIIDGRVRSMQRPEPGDQPDSMLDPEAIAQTYVDVLQQDRSAWSFEVEMRPWVETF